MTFQWFWLLLTIAVMAWYSTVTIYVAIRGSIDVKQMLRNLKEGRGDEWPNEGRGFEVKQKD